MSGSRAGRCSLSVSRHRPGVSPAARSPTGGSGPKTRPAPAAATLGEGGRLSARRGRRRPEAVLLPGVSRRTGAGPRSVTTAVLPRGTGRSGRRSQCVGDRAYGSELTFWAWSGGGVGRGDPRDRDVRAAYRTAVVAKELSVAFIAVSDAHPSTSCWPPSMSKVAPVTAVLVMRWTAGAAMSAD